MIAAAVAVHAQMPEDATLPERVLWVLAQERRPLGVYEIARRLVLSTERTHHSNSIYRVLDTLMAQGKVVPIASAKAWILNRQPEAKSSIILLCSECGVASQLAADAVDETLARLLAERRFEPRQRHVELKGRCRKCSGQGD